MKSIFLVSIMKTRHLRNFGFASIIAILWLAATLLAVAQSTGSLVVPHLIKFSGVVKNDAGQPKTGVVGITFGLYKEQEGGAALWLETQNVQADANGHYTVMLGSTKADGLPVDLFTSNEARWVGVQPQGQAEQSRVLLVSAPYALKAADAETLGGKPASAFLTASNPRSQSDSANGSSSSGAPAITGSGKKNFIPLWLSSSKLGSSALFQTSGNVGIGTTTPATTLDVNGTGGVRDTLTLFPKGSDPTLSVQGTAFAVSNTGLVSFVSGQTFPGTGDGTITGVTAGTDLTGGGSSGNVTLNLDTTKVPQLNGANTFTGNQTIKGGLAGQTGAFQANTSSAVLSAGNQNASGIAISGVNENTNGNGVGVQGTGPNGVIGNGTTRGVTGEGGLIGVEGDATGNNAIGVLGQVSSGTGVEGVGGDVGVEGDGAGIGVIAKGTNSTGSWGVEAVGGFAGVVAYATATSGFQNAVFGEAASSVGMGGLFVGIKSSTIGSRLEGCCPVGVWGDTGSNAGGAAGLVGTADDARAIYLENNSPSGVPTAFMQQDASGQLALQAGGAGGYCTVDTNGRLSCAHALSVVAAVDSGQRRVALYAVESPQNWFEDFGSGQLAVGTTTVSLDRTFTQTVNMDSDYHVFLTPRGECEGLYVSDATASGFEVHELHGGRSNVAFDYRIVALRRGYENVRLEDMTERWKNITAALPKGTSGERKKLLVPSSHAPVARSLGTLATAAKK